MSSPFPGMDPYLQARWSGVHVSLIAYIQEALQPLLPRDLRARAEERILLEDLGEDPWQERRPDVAVVETEAERSPRVLEGGVSRVEPVVVDLHSYPVKDRWVQIVDVSEGNRVVTAVELLSPWNKAPGRLNEDYRRKLEDYGRAGRRLSKR